MKMLKLPHEKGDYLCPINGLCDIYQWKTGKRLPDKLVFHSGVGFQMFSQPQADTPKLIFMGQSGIGRRQLETWSEPVGYQIHAGEGADFQTSLNQVRALLDAEIPVLLFGLNMFHLPYHKNFYHKIPVAGHVMLLVGYDEGQVYVHDNSMDGVWEVPNGDLQAAWADGQPGMCGGNAYFGIEMNAPNRDLSSLLRQGIRRNAQQYLNPSEDFMGRLGLEQLLRELPSWGKWYDKQTLRKILLHLLTYTGSTLPELPSQLTPYGSGIPNPHRGSRDLFAQDLRDHMNQLDAPQWEQAAQEFEHSGTVTQSIVDGFTQDLLTDNLLAPQRHLPLFEELLEIEERAFQCLLANETKDC